MKRLLCLVLLILMCPQVAQALCLGLAIKNLTTTQTFVGAAGEYNPFDGATYMQTVSFDVYGGASVAACTYFVDLSAGASGTTSQRTMALGGQTMKYDVYVDAGGVTPLKDALTATASQVISGSFANGTSGVTNHHSFSWTVKSQQVRLATATRYQDVANLTLYSGILTLAYVAVDVKAVTFQTKVDSKVDLSLVDSGTAFNSGDTLQTVDFGNLASSASKGFDIVIRSNDGYKISMQSANKQKLAYQGTSTDKVSYTLKVNTVAVDLSSGSVTTAAATTGTTTALTGINIPVAVTLDTLTGHETAGTYQDQITVTVSAN